MDNMMILRLVGQIVAGLVLYGAVIWTMAWVIPPQYAYITAISWAVFGFLMILL
jgi:F0F1-type ATP synthase membrane subunit a